MEEYLPQKKSSSRRTVESKLAQDEVRLKELQNSLSRSEDLTGGMVKILDSFTSRLKKLDDTILPVYNENLSLTRLQENVDKTLGWMQRVIDFYQVGDDVEDKVREGPGSGIQQYLSVLQEVRSAMDHFQQFNPDSMELEHLHELFISGREALIREFLQLLKKHSKPVPLATLHDLVHEDTEGDEAPPLPLLPAKVVADLRLIADYLVKAPGENTTDIMAVYPQIRCNQLGRAMRSLMESSTASQSMLPTSASKRSGFSSTFLKTGHTPTRRNTGKKGGGGVGGMGGASEGMSSSASVALPGVVGGEDPLEGCSAFMLATNVFLQLIQSEVTLMEGVVPPTHHAHVLNSLIKSPLDFFMSKGETLLQQARKGVAHHQHSIVLSCLRLLRHIKAILPQYRMLLKDLASKPVDRFMHLLQQFDRLCSKALQEDYIQFIKVDSEKLSNLPKDGTVHSLTSNTMRYLDSLLEYSESIGEIFQGRNSYSLSSGSTDVAKKKAVGQYVVRVVDALNMNMEHKARNYESPYLAALFLRNNYHFVLKSFTRNDQLLELMEEGFPDVENHYIGLVARQGHAYQRCFQKLLSYLGHEMSLANLTPSDKLSNQKRQLLKDKFKGFNSELDEILHVQQEWSVPDPVLRARLRTDNIDMLVPVYTDFYDKNAKLPFTKNPEKYLRYSPEDVKETLEQFFDGGAK